MPPLQDLGGAEDGDQLPESVRALHARCTASAQPFRWSGADLGAAERSHALRVDVVDSLRSLAGPDDLTASFLADGSVLDAAPPAPPASDGAPGTSADAAHAGPSSPPAAPSPPRSSAPASPPRSPASAATSTPHAGPATLLSLADQDDGQDGEGGAAEADEHCSATHPGSTCCTSTIVQRDASAHSCMVTLRTTATLTNPRLHVAASELEELAWMAARDAAADAMAALNAASARGPAGREERHRYVCHMLRHGTIRDAKRMENSFGHITYLLTLEEKGRRMRAAFKPRVEGDCEGWHRVPIEAAAYALNLLLGMDVVPPAVVRPEADVDWTHYPGGGAFIYWCSGAKQLDSVPMAKWSVPSEVLLSDTRILDVLIQNSDRHAGHFLWAEHWAQGEQLPPGGGSASGWRGRYSPVLIDHAAGFRPDAFVCLDHENAFLTGPTHRISARTYLRLRFLDAPSLRAALGGAVGEEEIGGLLSRRDAVLSFFDGLVASRGYDKVVLEP